MKLKNYIKSINELVKKYPECVDFEVIIASDDEGNSYQKSIYTPTLGQVHNLNTYELEVVGFMKNDNIKREELNVVCIN